MLTVLNCSRNRLNTTTTSDDTCNAYHKLPEPTQLPGSVVKAVSELGFVQNSVSVFLMNLCSTAT